MHSTPSNASSSRSAFTLIELLVVIAIIAILAVVVVLTLNPAELLRQSRDSNRMSDMQTLTSALNLYNEDQGGTTGYSLGTPNVIYLSIPDPTATSTAGTNCSGLGLPVSSTTYHCPASSTYRKTNGTGWIPVKFTSTTIGSPLSSLPVDPINTTSSGEYYQYSTDGTNFEIAGVPESQKYSSASSTFAAGSSRTLITLASSTKTCNSGTWNCAANNVCVDTLGDGSYIVVANTDASGTLAWKSTNTACTGPQCQSYSTTTNGGGGDGEYLVADNTVDFSAYPARAACQALGGRMPTVTELSCIYNHQSSFGGNFTTSTNYWSSAESSAGYANVVAFSDGANYNILNIFGRQVRCVFGW